MSETRFLPVRLSRAELELKAAELARAVDAYNLREAQNKDQAKANTEALKDLRTKITALASVVETKQERRHVEGTWVPSGKVASWVRLDTHEVVEERPLTADELQGDLFSDIENDRETH